MTLPKKEVLIDFVDDLMVVIVSKQSEVVEIDGSATINAIKA